MLFLGRTKDCLLEVAHDTAHFNELPSITIQQINMKKPNYLRNSGQPWKPQDVNAVRDLAAQNTPTRVIGLKLGRSEDSIRSQASQNQISLHPTNQSPYNRRSN